MTLHNPFKARFYYRAAANLILFTILLSIVLIGTTPVQAQSNPPANQGTSSLLEKAYQREQTAAQNQTDHLAQANTLAAKTQAAIDEAKSKGLDTTQLQLALTDFQSQLAEAQSAHNAGAETLAQHPGFDATGKVIDRAAAQQTITEVKQSLTTAHARLTKSVSDLHQAVKDWRTGTRNDRQTNLTTQAFQREHTWLTHQQDNLARSNHVDQKVQALIDRAKGQGEDTSSLENALKSFQSQIAEAQTSHTAAQNSLSTHAGFDDQGQVTDLQAARTTVKTARDSLWEAHITITKAVQDLRSALKTWRSAHPAAEPTPLP